MIRDISSFSRRQGNKPASAPSSKVLSVNGYNNGIWLCKEGREKRFSVKDSGAVE